MRALRQIPGQSPFGYHIAAEDFGFSEMEWSLVSTQRATNHDQAKYWNSGRDPATAVMKNVLIFIEKAVITYADLQTLLSLPWINPEGALSIKHLDNSCDLDKKEIAGLDNGALDRLHRFIRLWKRTRTPPETLDRAIRTTRSHILDRDSLVHVWDIHLVGARLNLPLAEICTFYGTLPDSRYSQIFLNSAVNGKVEAAFEPANILANQNPPARLSDHAPYIALCLGQSEAVIQLIIDSRGSGGSTLTLENLAAVYSIAILAQALNLSVRDLWTIQIITGIQPVFSPAVTLDYIDAVKKIQDANIAPSKLLFILTNTSNNAAIQDLTIDAVLVILQDLLAAYQPVILSHASEFSDLASPTENTQALMDVLSKVEGFDASTLAWFSKTLGMTVGVSLDEISSVIGDASQIARELEAKLSFLSTASLKAITTAWTRAIAPAASDADRNLFIRTLTTEVSAWLNKEEKVRVLNSQLQSHFDLSPEIITEILRHARLRQPASAGNALIADILTDAALDSEDLPLSSRDAARFQTQIWAIRLLSGMASYIPSLELSAQQIGWLLQHSPTFDWFQLDGLAYRLALNNEASAERIQPISWVTWASFQDLVGILKSYVSVQNPADPTAPLTVFGLFALAQHSTTRDPFISYFAQLRGLEPKTLISLCDHFQLHWPTKPFWQPESYLRVERAATILRQLGLDVPQAWSLCQFRLGAAESLVMRRALKARYADADWLGVLKAVQDPIRVRKRDALVAFLLATQAGWRTAGDLYRHYLIDVEMGASLSTSRIVQAHATIQLFVQRCLMGLEPGAVAVMEQDSGWSQWEWMANYRVWQANRKIFLWPENWLEPSLRPDKSEPFHQAENELSETGLSDEALEACMHHYLDAMEEVAQLEVMACHWDPATFVTHFVARTRGTEPHLYYHRRLLHEREWTPWSRIELDINGPQLLAFVRDGALCLAWPVISEESDPAQMSDPVKIPALSDVESADKSTDRPKKRWKMQLAVSEWSQSQSQGQGQGQGGHWKGKKLSETALHHPRTFTSSHLLPPSHAFTLYLWARDSQQAISVALYNPSFFYVGAFPFKGITLSPEASYDGRYERATAESPDIRLIFRDTMLEHGRFIRTRPAIQKDNLTMYYPYHGLSRYLFLAGMPEFKVTHANQFQAIHWPWTVPNSPGFKDLMPMSLRFSLNVHGTPFVYGDADRSFFFLPGFHHEGHGMRIGVSDLWSHHQAVLALHARYEPLFRQNPTSAEAQLRADPEYQRLLANVNEWQSGTNGFLVENFFHPLVSWLRTALHHGGLAALMNRTTQLHSSADFESIYTPALHLPRPRPVSDLDFSSHGAYACYNWELFFHLPYAIAVRLNQDGSFQAAQHWFHYIFNPLGPDDGAGADQAPQKYWITKPFFLTTTADYIASRLDQIFGILAADSSGAMAHDLRFAIAQWRARPFQPHVVAKTRPVAYQLAVVIRYVKNLIDWGDDSFRAYTRESITQATQYYMLADKLYVHFLLRMPGCSREIMSRPLTRTLDSVPNLAMCPRRRSRPSRRTTNWNDAWISSGMPSSISKTWCRASDSRAPARPRRVPSPDCISVSIRTKSCWPAGTWWPIGWGRSARARTSTGSPFRSRSLPRRSIPGRWFARSPGAPTCRRTWRD